MRAFLLGLAMPNESRLSITIDSRSAEQQSKDLETALGALDKAGVRVVNTTTTAGKTFVEAGRGARTGSGGVDEMGRSLRQTDSAAASAAATMKRMFLAATAGFSIMHVIDTADDWGQMASRIKQATKSQEEYEIVMRRTATGARETFRSLDESRELFVRTSQAIRDLGFSLEQSIDLTDSFSALLVTNAASGERGAAAINAYSKAVQTGRVDSESWQTILQAIPTVVDRIAESSGKSAAEIRKLGIEGKLSLGILNKALLESLDASMEAVADMPTTVRDALQNLGNAFKEYIGWQNEASGATAALSSGLGVLGENFGTIVSLIGVGAAGALGMYTARMGAATIATIAQAAASGRAAMGQAALSARFNGTSAAAARATVAMRTLNVVMGPAGWIALAASAAAGMYLFGDSADSAKASTIDLTRSTAELTKAYIASNEARRVGMLLDAESGLSQAKKQAQEATVALSNMIDLNQDLSAQVDITGQMGDAFAQLRVSIDEVANSSMTAEEKSDALVRTVREMSSVLPKALADELIRAAAKAGESTAAVQELTEKVIALRNLMSTPLPTAAVGTGVTDKLSDEYLKLEASVNRQIALIGKSGRAAQLRYDIEHGALSSLVPLEKEKALALVSTLDAREKAEEAARKGAKSTATEAKEIDNLLKTLREQAAVLGMTDQEAAKYRISMMAGTQAQKDRALALLDTVSAYKENIDVMREQRNLLDELSVFQAQKNLPITGMGLGERQRDLLEQEYQIREEYARRRRELDEGQESQSTRISEDALNRRKALLEEAEEAKIEIIRDAAARKLVAEQSWITGAGEALRNYADEVDNIYASVGNAVGNAFKGMEDALVNFVKTGKLNFADLADSIISDMVRIAIQQSITGPLAGMLGGAIGGMFSGSSLPATASWALPTMNAKGNVFDSPSLSMFSNQIHDTPKMFAFAKGAGVFGEAGPEAIMPLKRGPDGSLGVQAQGRSGGDVTVNIINQSSQPVTASQPKISMDAMGRMVVDVMISDLRRNGPYARQLKGGM